MSKIDLAIQKLTQIDEAIADFNQVEFLTPKKLLLQPNGKIVLEGKSHIFKFYQFGTGYSRKLMADLFVQLNCPIFLQTEVVRTFINLNGVLLKEPKIEVIEKLSKTELIQFMEQRNYDVGLLDKFRIKFYENNNSGRISGHIKIFDGVWGLYPVIKNGYIILQDSQGKEYIREEVII